MRQPFVATGTNAGVRIGPWSVCTTVALAEEFGTTDLTTLVMRKKGLHVENEEGGNEDGRGRGGGGEGGRRDFLEDFFFGGEGEMMAEDGDEGG